MRANHHLTADPGLEDLARDEILALAAARGVSPPVIELRPYGLAGHLHVQLEGDPAASLSMLLALRSVHRIVRPVATFSLPPEGALPAIRQALAALAPSIPELTPPSTRFRVTCSRVGVHPFTSEDVAREAGAGVRDTLPRGVSMKQFDVELRCDVRGDTCVVGVQHPGAALSRRDPGPYRPTTTLRASVAWGLLQLARLEGAPAVLLDPFAGAGTILLEAAARWPGTRLHGSDLHEGGVAGLTQNLAFAGLTERCSVRQGDARRLHEVWPGLAADLVVTNPPFGRRLGRSVDLVALYRGLLTSVSTCVTEDARMVVLVESRGAFNQAVAAQRAWRIVHVRVLEMGGLYVGAFVLARRAGAPASISTTPTR